jgi:hypothetical protein
MDPLLSWSEATVLVNLSQVLDYAEGLILVALDENPCASFHQFSRLTHLASTMVS